MIVKCFVLIVLHLPVWIKTFDYFNQSTPPFVSKSIVLNNMGNHLPTSSPFHIQTVSESDLNYDEMTKCPSTTMKIIKDSTQPNPAYTSSAIPWYSYNLDAWYNCSLDQFMISPPTAIKKLSSSDIHNLTNDLDCSYLQLCTYSDLHSTRSSNSSPNTTCKAQK